jgi:hypothetical protein
LLFELLSPTRPGEWALVGGLMTQTHALLAGVTPQRTTEDVDLLVDVLTRRSSVAAVVTGLESAGFEPVEPGWPESPFHRLRRGDDVIDLLVADHLPKRISPSVVNRPVMAIAGGAQARKRLMDVVVVVDKRPRTFRVPDLLGALILKAAAATMDSREAERHLHDAALLAALIKDHAGERARLHGSDRRRLAALAARLTDPAHPAWLALGDNLARRGQDTLRILTSWVSRRS